MIMSDQSNYILLYVINFFSEDTLSSNDIRYGVTSGFIFSTDQSAMGILNLKVSILSTYQELLPDWLIY
jgi:hypothetical protein